jgi:hypothetical protein
MPRDKGADLDRVRRRVDARMEVIVVVITNQVKCRAKSVEDRSLLRNFLNGNKQRILQPECQTL